jgi:hypothetical protein
MAGLAGCGFRVESQAVEPIDAAPDAAAEICDVAPDLAWWRLATVPTAPDLVAGRVAMTTGSVAASQDGPCGGALEFDANLPISYVTINDDDAWEALQRIELWVRTTDAKLSGILSRDSVNFADGSVSLHEATATDGTTPLFAVRLQRTPNTNHILCAPRPPPGTWSRIELQLGPPNEIWIDGTKIVDTTTVVNLLGGAPCTDSDLVMTNSPDPFVLGALNTLSTVGTTDNVRSPFAGGAISNLKFHTTRRP